MLLNVRNETSGMAVQCLDLLPSNLIGVCYAVCPKTNGYLTNWVQDHFSQNMPKFGFGDEKMFMKRGGRTSFFPKIPEIRIRGWELG